MAVSHYSFAPRALPEALSGCWRQNEARKKPKSLYHGNRFPAVVIICAVRWYFRFNLSLRDIEELLLERGVVVTYETIR
jgi:transposase-like protein